jgi:hypothetical protein
VEENITKYMFKGMLLWEKFYGYRKPITACVPDLMTVEFVVV